MGTFLRAIVAAVRSWFQLGRGRRNRLTAPAERADAPATDAPASGTKAEADKLARLAAEAEARRQAEEAARAAADAEERRGAVKDEHVRLAAETEACRQAEGAARAAADAEARRKAAADTLARLAAEAEARLQGEEAARAAADAEERRGAEKDERVRLAAEAEAHRQAEDAARAAADAEARRKADADERARLAAEAEVRRQAEEAARAAAETEAQRKAREEKRSRRATENEDPRQSEADAGPTQQAGSGRPPAPEEDVEPASEEEYTGEGNEPSNRRASRMPRVRPPRYRGPVGGPPVPRQPPAAARNLAERTEPGAGGKHVLPVELRVLFERGDSLRVTLLPRRGPGLPDELTVWAPSGTVDLVALQEDWYQDVAPKNLDALLSEGVLWRDEATGQEWLLSGREIFVLTAGTAHRGLVSCARLALGREHAVLCKTSRLADVDAVLREAGCEGCTVLDVNDGAPHGWILLCDVLPHRPVSWTDKSDILNALRPMPQIEIALEGGICLGYASWLAEHPPSIRVYGDPDHRGAIYIDGQIAIASADGRYTAPGWDSVGPHHVWCNGATKTYSLVRLEPPSQSWAAFSFPTPGTRGGGRLAICGPLVRSFTDPRAESEEAATSEIIQVPPANPVLLGSLPGQVVVAHPRSDVRGAQCIVSSPFAPVWAIPVQPLHCDKHDNRVRLVGEPLPPGEGSGEVKARISRASIELWVSAIRDAGKKGLAVVPPDPAVAELWRRYRRYARDLWRRLR